MFRAGEPRFREPELEAEFYLPEPEFQPLTRSGSDEHDPADDQIRDWTRGEYENPERRGRER